MKNVNKTALPFFYQGKLPVCCLLIHGFTGSPADMKPLGSSLLRQGYGISGLLLPGHGTVPQDLADTNWLQWYQAVEAEYLRLSDNYKMVIPCGFSLGGLLALYLAFQKKLKKVVSLNTPLFFKDQRVYELKTAKLTYFEKKRTAAVKKQNHNLGRFSYERIPVKAFLSLLDFIEIVKLNLSKIKASALLIQSKEDPLVKANSAQDLYDSLGSDFKKLVWLQSSKHVVTFGEELALVLKELPFFLKS